MNRQSRVLGGVKAVRQESICFKHSETSSKALSVLGESRQDRVDSLLYVIDFNRNKKIKKIFKQGSDMT